MIGGEGCFGFARCVSGSFTVVLVCDTGTFRVCVFEI